MLKCEDIESYLLNKENLSEEVKEHINTCPSCRLYAELLKEQPLITPQTSHKEYAVNQAILKAEILSKKRLFHQSILFALLALVFLASLTIMIIHYSWFGIVYILLIYTLLPLVIFSIKRKEVVS